MLLGGMMVLEHEAQLDARIVNIEVYLLLH
jgi:hypothetical protein